MRLSLVCAAPSSGGAVRRQSFRRRPRRAAWAAHLLQEEYEAGIAGRAGVCKGFADVARFGEPAALGEPEKKARQPVGEAAAEKEEVVVLQFAEEFFRRVMAALQRTDEFEHVLVEIT